MHGRSIFKIETVEGLARQPLRVRPWLGPTEIVILLARLEEAAEPEQRTALANLLSDDEKGRLSRFRFERDRMLFLFARVGADRSVTT
jgi:hypothetical protein